MIKKTLSVFRLSMINIIAIDSLRNLPTNAANGFLLISYYIFAVLFFLLPCILITAELATNYSKTGGPYVWVKQAFGGKWGLVTIWLLWVYNVVWYPTLLSFIGASIAYLINPALAQNKMFMVAVVLILFAIATLVNCYGMKISSLVSSLSAIFGTIIPILFIISLGAYWVFSHHPLAITPQGQSFIPHIETFHDMAFLVVILFSLMGFEMSSIHAEEVKNPKNDYPKALLYSSVIIVVTTILASLAIAIVIPKSELSLIGGLNQAFLYFLSAYHLNFLMPIITLLIIFGGFGGMAAWIIGPTKALMVSANDGFLPNVFSYKNKKGAPIWILMIQALLVAVLSTLFLAFDSLNTSYWILSDLTGQLALLYYVLFFAAAIKLRYNTNEARSALAYQIPGKNWGIWVCGLSGILTSSVVLGLGFLPPPATIIHATFFHEVILLVGILIFIIPPLLLYQYARRSKKRLIINKL
jgi:glutamate:GABA antiporter